MASIGVMIEGQDGLNWERWRRLCQDAERLGFASLRRSDHLFSVFESMLLIDALRNSFSEAC